jgi:peptidoglycan hydrolase-like protein with peptidoglycan-binding domain
MRRLLLICLLAPLGSIASGPFTALHPEAHEPDPTGQASADPYTGFISEVQDKLRALGFDAGPVNGDFGTKTQAALAQFQLSRTIPASGQLDELTLRELGVDQQQAGAAAGGTADGTATDGSTTDGTAAGG